MMKYYSLLLLVSALLLGVTNLEPQIQEYRKRQEVATPESVLEFLKTGNSRFASGKSTHGGYPLDTRERIQVAASGQRPIASVLSCIDSRNAPELLFDTSVGDLFTPRIGGTVVNDDIVGSLEIAAESGSKLIVVLGHTECGAVKGACTDLKLGHFTSIIERVKPAIAETHKHLDANPKLSAEVGERVVTNKRFVAEVSHMNASRSTHEILKRSQLLREKVALGEIQIVTALYDIDTGLVSFDKPVSLFQPIESGK